MISQEDKILLGSSIKEMLNRNFEFIRPFGEAPDTYAILMRHERGANLALTAKVGEPEGPMDDPYFLIHRFLMINSFDFDRPIVVVWKRKYYTPVKYLIFDPWRIMQLDGIRETETVVDGAIALAAPLQFGHGWILNQDFSMRWAQIKSMRKTSVPLDRFLKETDEFAGE